jgi:hypothetical protein
VKGATWAGWETWLTGETFRIPSSAAGQAPKVKSQEAATTSCQGLVSPQTEQVTEDLPKVKEDLPKVKEDLPKVKEDLSKVTEEERLILFH